MRSLRSGVAVFGASVIAVLSAAFSWGQAASPPAGITTIHVLSDLIEVPVLALKPPFRPAPALTNRDFIVRLDGGPPFSPRNARVEGPDPLSLTFLVEADAGNSNLLSQGLQNAIRSWSPTLLNNNTDRLSIYIYGCRLVHSLPESPPDFSLQRDEVVRSVSPAAFQAGAEGEGKCVRPPVENVLGTVLNQLSKTTNWKVIVLLINGEHKTDPKVLEGVQKMAAAEGVTLFAIKYIHDGRFPTSLYSETEGINLLVSSLGGITVHSSFGDLGSVTAGIIANIRQRYILGFPSPGNATAGLHRLEITSTTRGVRVVSSAAAAPLVDSTLYTNCTGNELCAKERPEYGTDKAPKGP